MQKYVLFLVILLASCSPETYVLKGMINFGEHITNCAFDPKEDYLYVTTLSQVTPIKLQPNK